MFRSIFTKSLRDYRWAILSWGIGLGLLVYFYYATILSQLAGTSSAQLQQLAGQFAFFGETVRADTPGGYITFKIMGNLPIVLGIWTLLAGARMTRGEEDRGALDILLSTPQSRLGLVVPTLAHLFIKPDNDLALMLLDKSLYGSSPNGSQHLTSAEEEGS